MNEWEYELGFEELPTDDEYLDMKAAYKLGKKDFSRYVQNPPKINTILYQHYWNGWLYEQWLDNWRNCEKDSVALLTTTNKRTYNEN